MDIDVKREEGKRLRVTNEIETGQKPTADLTEMDRDCQDKRRTELAEGLISFLYPDNLCPSRLISLLALRNAFRILFDALSGFPLPRFPLSSEMFWLEPASSIEMLDEMFDSHPFIKMTDYGQTANLARLHLKMVGYAHR